MSAADADGAVSAADANGTASAADADGAASAADADVIISATDGDGAEKGAAVPEIEADLLSYLVERHDMDEEEVPQHMY